MVGISLYGPASQCEKMSIVRFKSQQHKDCKYKNTNCRRNSTEFKFLAASMANCSEIIIVTVVKMDSQGSDTHPMDKNKDGNMGDNTKHSTLT